MGFCRGNHDSDKQLYFSFIMWNLWVSGEFYNKLWRQPWIIFFTSENLKNPATLLCQTIIDFISISSHKFVSRHWGAKHTTKAEENNCVENKWQVYWTNFIWYCMGRWLSIQAEIIHTKNILELGKQSINALRFTDVLIKCSLDDWNCNCLLSWAKDIKINLQH